MIWGTFFSEKKKWCFDGRGFSEKKCSHNADQGVLNFRKCFLGNCWCKWRIRANWWDIGVNANSNGPICITTAATRLRTKSSKLKYGPFFPSTPKLKYGSQALHLRPVRSCPLRDHVRDLGLSPVDVDLGFKEVFASCAELLLGRAKLPRRS